VSRIAALVVLLLLAFSSNVARAERYADDPEFLAEMQAVDRKLHELVPDKRPAVVLVTMGIGNLIWERHGHIALCVLYDERRKDACYNYGVADFQHPIGMAWGFFRQTNSFWVGKSPPRDMINIYVYFDRTVWAQPLPLNPEQTQKVIEKLENDILEEHKYYAYDHFDDNCTTRARDIIDDVTNHELKSLENEPTDGKTFRDLARDGFFGMRIPLLITDIAMGRSTDRVPSYWERMFLPQYLREAVLKKWNIEPVVLYERKGAPPLDDGPSGRVWFALVIILLTAPAWATRLWGRFERAGLAFALIPQFILGFVLLALAIISTLPYVRWNESCLVLFPGDLAMLFLGEERRRKYARFRVGMLAAVALLHLVGVLKQPLFAPILWPLIPCAVVGFWDLLPLKKPATPPSPETPPEPATPAKPRGRGTGGKKSRR
jgi:uncharacterized protein DUF4105